MNELEEYVSLLRFASKYIRKLSQNVSTPCKQDPCPQTVMFGAELE